jgi:hypothetical protein
LRNWVAPSDPACEHGVVTEQFSWARVDASGADSSGMQPLRRRPGAARWFDLFLVLFAVIAWDFVSGLAVSFYYSVHCGGGQCSPHQALQRDQALYWLVPVVMLLAPVLVVLYKRKLRLLVAGLQLVLLVAITAHTAYDAHVQRERLNGTVPCWNPLYTPKECPWGTQ